jgi:MFS family permease
MEGLLVKEDAEEIYDLSYAKKAMSVLVILPVLVMYTEAVLIPSLPTIQREFGVTPGDVGWVLSIYLLTGTISVAILGKLGDIYGKRKLFLYSLAIYTVGVLFTGFSKSFSMLLASRALQGIGMAIFPLGFTIVREEFPPRMVPQVQGMISAMFGVGIVLALPLGSYIAQNYGWQMTYHTVVPFVLALLFIAAKVLRESRYVTPGKMDWVGGLILSVFAATGLVGVTIAPREGWMALEPLSLFTVSLISLAILLYYEKRVKDPLIPMDMLKDNNVLIANIGIFLTAFAIQMMNQSMIYVLQMPPPYGHGKNILQSGLLMTPNALVMLIIAPIIGKLMTKIGAKPFALIGALIAVAGMLALTHNPQLMSLTTLVGLIVVVGTSISTLNVSLINILIFTVDRRVMGVATGLNSLFRNLGASWGPAIAGTIMSMYSKTITFSAPGFQREFNIPLPKAYTILFTISAILFLILAVLTLATREVVKNPEGV